MEGDDMRRTWPKDNLLDDMADEFAQVLYPFWSFSGYGVRNPWAFRLACRAALRVTDDGEILLEPDRLVEALDFHMKTENRKASGSIEEDEPLNGTPW